LTDAKGDPEKWKKEEIKRLKKLADQHRTTFISDLIISGDQFLADRKSSLSKTIIAGYPWFTDWGRDTMIAMRGLVIATGRKKDARSILQTFLNYLDRGMIPNRFPDTGAAPEYNTMDATLWLFVALHDYYEQFADRAFLRKVFDQLTDILEQHIRGTRFNIHITPEGLLFGGQEGTQLTWMDAKVGDYVVTPRIGCPVEINALWYNALCIYVSFGNLLGKKVDAYARRAKEFKHVFRQWFINDKHFLNDVVYPGQRVDDSIRPNQLYAISLPYSPLSTKEGKRLLKAIAEHLYTDYGLRSLSPLDPQFKPVFSGDQWHRDNAYHQGTVWSFLWGEYALAYLSVHHYSPAAKKWVNKHVAMLRHHFYAEEGLHGISENFDGGQPKEGKGCIQQAWSIGMTLLALLKAGK
jgi:predicted glycogen debranching enzyme